MSTSGCERGGEGETDVRTDGRGRRDEGEGDGQQQRAARQRRQWREEALARSRIMERGRERRTTLALRFSRVFSPNPPTQHSRQVKEGATKQTDWRRLRLLQGGRLMCLGQRVRAREAR